MDREQYIFETNTVCGGFLVDRRTDQIVGTTSRGIDRYFVYGEKNNVTGRVEIVSGDLTVSSKSKSPFLVAVDWADVTIGTPTANWTCVKSSDKTVFGLQTLKVSATAGAADDGVIVLTFPAKYFGAAKRLGFGICTTDAYIAGNTTQIVQMFINTVAGGHRIQCASNDSHVSGDFDFRWSYVGVDLENVVSGQSKWPNLAVDKVTSISLVVKKRTGAVLDPMYISPLISDPVSGVSPSILTIFMDGNYVSQFEATKTLNSRGLVASLAIVVPRVDSGSSYLTLSQVADLYGSGNEFICHTGTTGEVGWNDTGKYPDGSEYALVKADIDAFKAWAASNWFPAGKDYAVVGFTNGLDIAQTITRRNNISQALRDAGVIKIRQLGTWTGAYYGDCATSSLTNCNSTMLDSGMSVATITGVIDTLIARPGSWHGLTIHRLVAASATGNEITGDTFRKVVDYIDAKVSAGQLRVMTFSKAMQSYR